MKKSSFFLILFLFVGLMFFYGCKNKTSKLENVLNAVEETVQEAAEELEEVIDEVVEADSAAVEEEVE